MAIRPVDMQVLMPRTTEVIKSDTNLAIRPDVKSQETVEVVQKQVQAAQEQVLRKHESQKANIDKDGRNGAGGQSGGRKKQKQEQAVSVTIADVSVRPPQINELGSRYDFTI